MKINLSNNSQAASSIIDSAFVDHAEILKKYETFRARLNSGLKVGDVEFGGRKVSSLIRVGTTEADTGTYPCIVWNPEGSQRELSLWNENGKETFVKGNLWRHLGTAMQDAFILQVYDVLKVDYHQAYFDARFPDVRDILAVKRGGLWSQFSWKGNGFVDSTKYIEADHNHFMNFVQKHEMINELLQSLIVNYPARITFWNLDAWSWFSQKYFDVLDMDLKDYSELRLDRIATSKANQDLGQKLTKKGSIATAVDRSQPVIVAGIDVRKRLRNEAVVVIVDGVKLSLCSTNQAGIDKYLQAVESGLKVEVVSK